MDAPASLIELMFACIILLIAVNLAASLANRFQLAVGLLDADVYEPSILTMMKLQGKPEANEDLKMIPKENYGVKCMSMGFLVEKDVPIVWRGPMVMSDLEKMAKGVEWRKLDILVVDMPPRIDDAQLTILHYSTFKEVLTCLTNLMFRQPSFIFRERGARRTAAELSHEYLGGVNTHRMDIRSCCDEGNPIIMSSPDSASARHYIDVAQKVMKRLKELSQKQFHLEISI
ncbi:Iron-sulfur protein NUBPL [Bienertia sinuspersici]